MPNYRLKQEVPWKNILEAQRWLIDVKIDHYRNLKQYENTPRSFGPEVLDEARVDILTAYETYLSLRAFLGYHSATKYDRIIQEFLQP
ncbi:MAG: hypothetical protein HFJ84_04665 [Clostridiales bacterium]|jgi:hypothetical protein|nr:hypothetical protein [Clostridiales bacterium]